MIATIDFHSHILPNLDHGCEDLSQSLAQIAMMARAGCEVAVATSHFYPHRMSMDAFLHRRDEAADLLCKNLPENAPRIAVAAEVYCQPGLENVADLSAFCVQGTRCMLLEMPLGQWTEAHFETVDALANDGYTLLMAHIDRYPEHDVERLLQLDVQAQVNASSLCSFFKCRRMKRWLAEDRVYAIGSDLHGAEKGGYDHFPKALSVLGDETVRRVMAHSQELLSGAVYLK